MRRSTFPLVALPGGVVARLATPPAAAAGADSTTDALIGALSSRLIVLAVTIAVLVEIALLYALLRYRNTGEAHPPEYNPRLHITWVIAVGVVLLFVGVASLQTMAALDQQQHEEPPEDAVQVEVHAQQWNWAFEYPAANVTNRGTLVVPANETVHLRLTSRDVIHSFHAPELGLKRDANPAQWNTLTFTPTSTGEYDLLCAEYCGQGHSTMLGTVRVIEPSEYEDWLDEQADASGGNQTTVAG